MTQPANNKPLDHLTLAKVAVQEEMGEVLQILGKIDRFGIRSSHPGTGVTNIEELAGELGDLQGALGFYIDEITDQMSSAEQTQFFAIMFERQNGKRAKLIDYNERRGGEGA